MQVPNVPASFPQGKPPELWGVVTAVQANFYWVRLHQPVFTPEVEQRYLLCTRRARLRKIGQQVMVGDRVGVEEPDWESNRGAIAVVYPRETQLDRPLIANVNQILLVFALAEPDLDPQQLSRFLVKAESTGLGIVLCLNKQDLVGLETCQYWQRRLQQWGYEPVMTSVQAREESLAPLSQRLTGGITVICGPSGVGKSSLVNRLVPQATLRTGAVSGKLGRGRHTTRHVELFELPEGGFLADTPGFNQPDLTSSPEALGLYFPEIRQRLAGHQCQFNDCLHRDEPGCAVGTAWDRYALYLTMLDEALDYQQAGSQRREKEATLKIKVGDLGQTHQEPLLPAKTYRRPSRRRQKQTLDSLRYNLPESLDHLEELDDL